MDVTFIIIIIYRCVKSSVLGAPLGSPGGETHTGEGLTVWGSPDGLWPSSLCLEVRRQGNGSLSLFFFFIHVFGGIFVLPLSTIIRQYNIRCIFSVQGGSLSHLDFRHLSPVQQDRGVHHQCGGGQFCGLSHQREDHTCLW